MTENGRTVIDPIDGTNRKVHVGNNKQINVVIFESKICEKEATDAGDRDDDDNNLG